MEKKKDNSYTMQEIIHELVHYQKTRIPRCQHCYKDFVKEDKYSWKPVCKCAKNVRLSIG